MSSQGFLNSSVKKTFKLRLGLLEYQYYLKKNPLISTETFIMVINLPKTLLQTQSFFTVWNQKQMNFIFLRTRSRERKLLKLKRSSKTFTTIKKLYQMTYILCNPLWFLFVHPFHTNLLAPRGTFGL